MSQRKLQGTNLLQEIIFTLVWVNAIKQKPQNPIEDETLLKTTVTAVH
jgi:hypothetical protein